MARSHVDWPAARAFYVALPPGERSYSAVSRRFKVSVTSVAKHGRNDDPTWPEAAKQADTNRGRKLLDRAIRTREQRGEAILRIADEVYDQLQEQLLEKTLDVKLADLPAIDRMVRLELGEATDRVSVEEMRSGFQTLLVVAVQFVPKPQQPEFLEAANRALGVSVEEAA